jgi:uncharacterized cupin superfamily protein
MTETIPESRPAELEETPAGAVPKGPGWFVLNARDAPWDTVEGYGRSVGFETRAAEFPDFGLNIHRLEPGEPNGYYHAESAQEGYLVVSGRCTLIVEGEERALEAWDYVHLAAGTPHVLLGAGDGPSLVVMVGARRPDAAIVYPVDERAIAAGAGVRVETTEPREAYAGFPPTIAARCEEGWLPG